MCSLAHFYYRGIHCAVNYDLSIEYSLLGSKLGYPYSMSNLGVILYLGIGGKIDKELGYTYI